mgnify:CR=1 FL=1
MSKSELGFETQGLRLNKLEKKIALNISRIFAFRMLGLFIILPIFSLYAENLSGSTPFLLGLALGVYGLMAGIMQAPMGMLSDYFGRKKIITIGLILFFLGSVLAGCAHNIYLIILGRGLQGLGAIGSSLMALLADSTRDEVRFKAMSLIGMTIGLTFMAAMIIGPVMASFIGLSGVFYFTAILSLIGLFILWRGIPNVKSVFHKDQEFSFLDLKIIIKNKSLWILNLGVFILHAVLTSTFLVFPILLLKKLGLSLSHQWMVYFPVLIISFGLVIPLIILGEKRRILKFLMLLAIFILIFIEIVFMHFAFRNDSILGVSTALVLFFFAFTLLEAIMPSLVSKIAKPTVRGTAMGLYSSMQFLGIFVGGAVGGYLYSLDHHFIHLDGLINNRFGSAGLVFIAAFLLCVFWFFIVLFMPKPSYLATRVLKIDKILEPVLFEKANKFLKHIPGVVHVYLDLDSDLNFDLIYLKIDTAVFEDDKLFSYSERLSKNIFE